MHWGEILPIQCGTIGQTCENSCPLHILPILSHDPSDVSRTSNISVSSYLRTAPAQGHDDMGNDLLMGRVDLTPTLEGHVCSFFVSVLRCS